MGTDIPHDIDGLKRLVTELLGEVRSLREQNRRLREENQRLTAENEQLKGKVLVRRTTW